MFKTGDRVISLQDNFYTKKGCKGIVYNIIDNTVGKEIYGVKFDSYPERVSHHRISLEYDIQYYRDQKLNKLLE